MKIVHVITGLATGGAERTLYNLLTVGFGGSFDCRVISLSGEGTFGSYIRAAGIPLECLEMRPGRPSIAAAVRLGRLLRTWRPDIIQGWMYHGNIAASLPWFVGQGVPVVWNIRHPLYGLAREKRHTRWVIRGNRLLSSLPRAIIYNSELSRVQHECFGFRADRGCVIPNGFNLDQWCPDSTVRAVVRAELDIPDAAPLIGHIARYHPMKDHRTYLRALIPVVEQFPLVHFLIAGRDVEHGNPKLADLLAVLPADRIHLLGERDDVERLMPALDVFCLSSVAEAFPNVLGEAMACGVPCVATDVGDSADIVGETGIVVSPGDSEVLAQGLLAMLRKSSGERRALGQMARQRVETNYGLDAIVAQYARLYEEIARTESR